MRIERNLTANRLFADDDSQERFRRALDREVEECREFRGGVREVILAESTPEAVAALLASLVTKVPVLLASRSWGNWTWEAWRRVKDSPVDRGTVLIRTGGSTGEPKFAIHTWESLQASAENLCHHLGRSPLSSVLDLPLNHVSGWMPVMRALVSGGQLRCLGGGSGGNLPGKRLLSVVPTTLFRALEDREKLEALRQADRVFAGGAAFSPELLRAAREEGIPLSLVYGMTETAAMVAMQEPEEFLTGGPPVVSPISGNRISIEQGNRICLESDQLFAGYLGRPGRGEGPWDTGDLGDLDEAGRLNLWGRGGRFISSGGETVSLEKVETAAKQLEGVSDVYAAARSDPEWGERIHLFLVYGEGAERDWRKELKRVLDPHEIPAQVEVLPEIPRNGAGKVDPDRLFG